MVALSNAGVDVAMESGDQVIPNAALEKRCINKNGLDERPDITWRNWLSLAMYVLNTIVTYTSLTGIFGATNTELSTKYQTLVTPSGWAFSIWGPIFIWEGIFVIGQFLPAFRQSNVVSRVSPWWWGLCIVQVSWTIVFAQDQITLALIFMISILGSLSGIAWSTDGLSMSTSEYFLLRAPFSLQLGWIIAATVVSINVQADSAKTSQEGLLALAILSMTVVLAVVSFFTFGVRSPDPIVGFVAAWAFAGVSSELSNPIKLNDPNRFNPSIWGDVILGGLKSAALVVSLLALMLAVVAMGLRMKPQVMSKRADSQL